MANGIEIVDNEILVPVVETPEKRYFNPFLEEFPGLTIDTSYTETPSFGIDNLSEDEIAELAVHLEFWRRNPRLPTMNLTNKLENFEPISPSQKKMLEMAYVILESNDATAGWYVWGSTGVGKTHLSIALAKEFMLRGHRVAYYNPEMKYGDNSSQIMSAPNKFRSGDVVIVDDMNSPFGVPWSSVKELAMLMNNLGGRLLVTSNRSYAEVLESGFVSDEGNRDRYLSRTNRFFRVLEVHGPDRRLMQAGFFNGDHSQGYEEIQTEPRKVFSDDSRPLRYMEFLDNMDKGVEVIVLNKGGISKVLVLSNEDQVFILELSDDFQKRVIVFSKDEFQSKYLGENQNSQMALERVLGLIPEGAYRISMGEFLEKFSDNIDSEEILEYLIPPS